MEQKLYKAVLTWVVLVRRINLLLAWILQGMSVIKTQNLLLLTQEQSNRTEQKTLSDLKMASTNREIMTFY